MGYPLRKKPQLAQSVAGGSEIPGNETPTRASVIFLELSKTTRKPAFATNEGTVF